MNRWFYKTCANLHKIFGLKMCGIYKFTFFKFYCAHAACFPLLCEIMNYLCACKKWSGLRLIAFCSLYLNR